MWGIADTSIRYHPASGETEDHLFGVGPTPYGALSTLAATSFAQQAAVPRNLALASLNTTMSRLVQVRGRGGVVQVTA